MGAVAMPSVSVLGGGLGTATPPAKVPLAPPTRAAKATETSRTRVPVGVGDLDGEGGGEGRGDRGSLPGSGGDRENGGCIGEIRQVEAGRGGNTGSGADDDEGARDGVRGEYRRRRAMPPPFVATVAVRPPPAKAPPAPLAGAANVTAMPAPMGWPRGVLDEGGERYGVGSCRR